MELDRNFLNKIVDGYTQYIKDLPAKQHYNYFHGSNNPFRCKGRFAKYLIGLNLSYMDYQDIENKLAGSVDEYVRAKLEAPKKKVVPRKVVVEDSE